MYASQNYLPCVAATGSYLLRAQNPLRFMNPIRAPRDSTAGSIAEQPALTQARTVEKKTTRIRKVP